VAPLVKDLPTLPVSGQPGDRPLLGLDIGRFWDQLRRGEHAGRVADDVASADASGVAGTPSFFINGKRHKGACDVATLTSAARARAAAVTRHAASTG
jgi:predicted DsbA family dithiol-disulfide isomerase